MVHAATVGAIDFEKANTRDRWWWRRLQWVVADLDRELRQRSAAAQHLHWITAFANSRLDEEGFKSTQANARQALTELLCELQPWRRDALTAASTPAMDDALAEYRAEFGHPGDPRYEAMLQETMAAFKALEDGK